MKLKVIVAGLVLTVVAGLFAYNRLSGFTVAPNERQREKCRPESGGYYRWSIFDHRWVCRDNWVFPGVPGV
jgi:hypothetical protein